MSIRIGIPSVGLFCFETSGLFLSRPPGIFSHATAPHMLPLHSATRMLATPSATFQSPVGSAAKAGVKQVAKKKSAICRSEEHTSELQSLRHLVCRLLLEKKKKKN